MRVGVNSGEALVHEIGGEGHVAYPAVGDTINTGAARGWKASRQSAVC